MIVEQREGVPYVVRIPGRRMFLRWDVTPAHTAFASFTDGTSGIADMPAREGPALGGRIVQHATREEAEALLAKCVASLQMRELVERCVVELLSDEDYPVARCIAKVTA